MSRPPTQEGPRRGGPGLLARILAVPLVPFVAAWELAVAIARGIGPAIRWILKVAEIVVRAVFTAVRIVAGRLWGLVTWPFRLLGRGIAWVAGQLARALLPIVVRAWFIVRALLKAFVKAARAIGARAVVPLRLLGRAALALAIRIGLLLRAFAKLAWLALRAIGARILAPLRIAARTLVSLARRLFLVLRALITLVLRAARAVAGFVWTWLLAPIARAVAAIVNAARWLLRRVGAALRQAAVLAFLYLLPFGRAIWIWLLAPIARGLWAVALAARWLVRQVGSLLRWTAGTVRAAALVALSALAWVFRPVVLAWRWATGAVAAATSFAIAIVRSSIHTARVAVVLSTHDARNLIRKALGRPSLPPPDLTFPTRKRGRPVHRKPAVAGHPSQSDEPLWAARRAPEGGHVSASTTGARGRGWAWAGAAAIVLALVVGLIIMPRGGSQPVARNVGAPLLKVIAEPENVSESCPLLQPGGPTSTNGEAACGSLSVLKADTSLVCAKQSHLSAPWTFVGRDPNSGNVKTGPWLSFVGNSCRLQSPPDDEAELDTPEATADVVLIVDFVRIQGNFQVGLAARCSSDACVSLEADTQGSVWMAERIGSTWVTRASTTERSFPLEVNRMVMWVGANIEIAWLNGKLIATVRVQAGKPAGEARFFVSAGGNYNPASVAVDLRQFVVASLA